MEKSNFLQLDLMEKSDFADIVKVSDNFRTIDAETKKSNNNDVAIKEALRQLGWNSYFIDQHTKKPYFMFLYDGELHLVEDSENAIVKLSESIVTKPATIQQSSYVDVKASSIDALTYAYVDYTEKIETEEE